MRKKETEMKKFAAILIVLALAGTVQAGVIAGNYLTNGDFDTDLSGWSNFYGFETWTSGTPDGGGADYSADSAGAGMAYYIPTTTYTCTEGDVLTQSCDMAAGPGGATNPVYFRLYTDAGGYIAGTLMTFSSADLNSGWTTQTQDVTIPAGFDGEQMYVWINTWPYNNALLDNVYVTPEPMTLATLVIGAGLVAMRRRRR